VARGRQPDGPQARHRRGRRRGLRGAAQVRPRGWTEQNRDRARPRRSPRQDAKIGELIAEGVRQGRQGRCRHRRGVADDGPLSWSSLRALQFDKGYNSRKYFVTDQERLEACTRGTPTSWCTSPRSPRWADFLPLARERFAHDQEAAAGGGPKDVEGRGPWRRSSSTRFRGLLNIAAVKAPGFGDRRKAMPRRHRDPHRRDPRERGPRHEAGVDRPRGARLGPPHRGHEGQHHDRGRRRRLGRDPGADQPDQDRDRRRPTPTGTAKKLQEAAWPSCPAAVCVPSA